MKAFLKKDISKRIERSISVIQSWVTKGLVLPEIIPSQGRGYTRVYSQQNLLQFAFVDCLLRLNVGLSAILWIMDCLRGLPIGKVTKFGETYKMDDFFTNPEWGSSIEKDIIFVEFLEFEKKDRVRRQLYSGTETIPLENEFKEARPAALCISLGMVLRLAKKKIGIK